MSTYGGTQRTAHGRTLLICALCRKRVLKRVEGVSLSMQKRYVGNVPCFFHTFVMKTGLHRHTGISKCSGSIHLYRRSDDSYRTISFVVIKSRRVLETGFLCVYRRMSHTLRCFMVENVGKSRSSLISGDRLSKTKSPDSG